MTNDQTSLQPAGGVALPSGPARRTAARGTTDDRSPAWVEARLDAGDGQAAARTLLAAVEHGSFPGGVVLGDWLAGLHPDRRAKLVSAFAHYPCFVCRHGLESCGACGGSGFSAAAQVCNACAGFGEKRCDFCAGSGLATYSVMPAELWPNVLTARANRAVKYLEKVMVQPSVDAAARIHDLNKLLGVIENALAALRQLVASGVVSPGVAVPFVRSCKRAALPAIDAIRDALRQLAEQYNHQASALPPVDAANAQAKAEFYAQLATSDTFEGTGLSHPFFPVRTAQHLAQQHQAQQQQETPADHP